MVVLIQRILFQINRSHMKYNLIEHQTKSIILIYGDKFKLEEFS